jgi:hypothetical protein
MMTKQRLLFLATLSVAGCHSGGGKPGSDDPGTPPSPMASHVSASGVTAGLVAGGTHAAYLLNPRPAMSGTIKLGTAGELHVTNASGRDFKVASDVLLGRYVMAPDGSALFYIGFDLTNGPGSGTASLNYLSLATDGAMPRQVAASGAPVTNQSASPFATIYVPDPLVGNSLFSPSSKFFLAHLAAAVDATTPDLHVYDTSSGNDVYQRPNGAAVYTQLVMPDDTMIFQDTAAGTSPSAPPLQTLYWVKLGGSPSAATITTRAAQFTATADNKTLVILRTNGDVVTWSIGSSSPASSALASGAAEIALGNDANGPIAWIGADHSLHVVTTDGNKKLDLAAAVAAADYLGPLTLSPDRKDLYYWQSVEQQDNRGTLWHVGAGGGTPVKVADKASLLDLTVTGNALVLEDNVDDLGQLGGAAAAQRDGSKLLGLGMGAVVGGLRVATPDDNGWIAMHLDGAAIDGDLAHTPIDGSLPISGALAFDNGSSELVLDAAVHTGGFALSPSGKTAIYVAGAAWNDSAQNWVGALTFAASSTPTMKVDGKVRGVSELGPIVSRKLFVNAPAGNPAGVYYLSY